MENSRRTSKLVKTNKQNPSKNKLNAKDDIIFKNVLIIVLIVICLAQAIYIVFYTLDLKENSVKNSFLKSYVSIQKNVSLYLGKQSQNMYEAYNYSQILTGTILDEEGNPQKIKGTDGVEMIPLVNQENKIEMDTKEYYVLNSENIKANFKIEVPSYKNMTWYVSSDGDIKVKCESKPNWWTTDLDCLTIGN